MDVREWIGLGLGLALAGIILVAFRGLSAFLWFQSLFERRIKVFEGSTSEAVAFEDACKQAGIPCEVHVGDRDLTLEVWVSEKRARDARALRPNSASRV